MKKIIGIFLITIMVLSIGLLTCGVSAAPEAAPAQVEQAPAQPTQEVPQTLMSTTINLDGSAFTTYSMEVEQDVIDKMPNFVETITKQVEKSGYSVELLDKDGKKVLMLKKEIKKGEKLTFAPPGQDPEGFEFMTVKGVFSTMYIASAGFDMRGYPAQEMMKFTFQAPLNPTYSNAEVKEKGGLVSTWSIKGGSANPIKFIITVPNFVNIAILLLVCAILIFILLILVRRRRLKRDLVVLPTEEYVEAGEVEDEAGVESEDDLEDTFEEVTTEKADVNIEETDKEEKE